MRKRILCILCAILLLFGFIPAGAASLDPTQLCSLTLSYHQGDTAFPDLNIAIYRAAEARADGSFHLTADYAPSGVDISHVTSQQEWRDIADTLSAYIAGNRIAPTKTATTAADGTAVFSGLETGLYLVGQTVADSDEGSRLFEKFMVYLPTPVDGGYDYDVTANPKSSLLPSAEEYQVLKLWKDSGFSNERPASVSVDILKDGVVQETVSLSADNNWSYSWNTTDTAANWTVNERAVPPGYRANISTRETTFIITNIHIDPDSPEIPDPPDTPDVPDIPGDPDVPAIPDEPSVPVGPVPPVEPEIPEEPDDFETPTEELPNAPAPGVPKTGDTAPLGLYIMAMSISGLILMVLGLGSRRSKHHEKKR